MGRAVGAGLPAIDLVQDLVYLENMATTVNVHEAKTHLSKLVERAAEGESFIIAKAGRPLVKVVPLDQSEIRKTKRLGFMQGEFHVPDDFDRIGNEEIDRLFSVNGL